MLRPLLFSSLALSAAFLAACATATPVAPQTPAAASDDDQSRAVRGSTLAVSLGQVSGTVPVYNENGTIVGTTTAGITGTARLQLASDSLAVDRMGYWNPIAVDGNNNSNTNYGKDLHLQLTLPTVNGSVKATKLTLVDKRNGLSWDTVGYPTRGFLGAFSYSSGTFTQLLSGAPNSGTTVSSGQVMELYIDTNYPATNDTVVAGDTLTATLDTSAGPVVFDNLKL